MAQRRISKDLADIQNNPSELFSVELVGDSIYHWKGKLIGPQGTPYEGGVFVVDIVFPYDYPLKAPRVSFDTKIYHPNVGANGEICLDILKQHWRPIENMKKVLTSLSFLLSSPEPDDALMAEIANQYKTQRETFNETAREWTRQYATASTA